MNPQSVPPESLLSSDAPLSSSAASDSASISFPPLPVRVLDEYDLRSPRRRRALPLFLFLATCFFTYAAGTYRWVPTVFGLQIDPTHGEYWDLGRTFKQLATNWHDGLIYMSCVMAVLLAHEMGHFLMTVRYRIPASYPDFYPRAADAHRHDGRRDRDGRVSCQPAANVRYRPGRPMGRVGADSAAGVDRH